MAKRDRPATTRVNDLKTTVDTRKETHEALREIIQLSVLPPRWRLPLPDGAATKHFSNNDLLKRLQMAVAIAEDALNNDEL